ncbi:MAG: TIM barrel protein [Deltaproteobacteria bacterium]|nr:TIM barrel protein [Deltaproteobacteria bacterium]
MKKSVIFVAVVMLAVAFLVGSAFAQQKMVLKKYPEIKLGYTTTNFLKPLPVSLDNKKKLLDLAGELGCSWVEIRDPSASLTVDECKQLMAYAKSKNIEIGYALQVGLLDPTYGEIFTRGLPNAAVFEGPRTIRTLAAGPEFASDPKKKYWTLAELYKAIQKANRAANAARSMGLKYVVENAFEALKGDGMTGFGLSEFIANANSNMFLQCDTANFFAVSRVVTKPEEAKAFMEKYAGRMPYIHIKASSSEHKVLPVLAQNELDFDTVFSILTKNKVRYAAIELTQPDTFEACANNLKKSFEYLVKNY